MKTGYDGRVRLRAIATVLVLAVGSLVASGAPVAQEKKPAAALAGDGDEDAAPAAPRSLTPAARAYSPYAGRKYPTRAFFGDTHLHTANSGDAVTAGNRLGPEEAFRFARGEEVVSSSGVPVRLSRPLDFLVVSDHAEGLGVMFETLKGNVQLGESPTSKRWYEAMKAGGEQARAAANEIVKAQSDGTIMAAIGDPTKLIPVMRSVWQAYTATADKYNEPGHFTAMIGFEWTSVPGGNNLHRNVLFRDASDKASQILPYSSWQSQNPEDLWKWMGRYEQKTGGRVLAIPHNGNLSNGRMFAVVDVEGKALTQDYATRRARWEPLVEVMQTKGNSETHPTLSPNDEFADYGVQGWDNGNLSLTGEPQTPAMRPYSYIRGALLNGLKLGKELGANPFKIGMAGGTDMHTSLTAAEESSFFGKSVPDEPTEDRWSAITKKGIDTRYGWQTNAAGYTAVWATENTREALWDAMMRKETYATSGTRITVRMFGGWDFKAADARARDVADVGYARGVPMGGDLSKAAAGKAPTFLVAAMKDPLGANLDRIQIIKGWLDAKGETHERVYDVAWGDANRRKPGKGGKLPPVGDTVDLGTATWTNTIGDPDLSTVWRDPDFNPAQPAFYYARVIEIPTPRWTAYDAVRFGIKMSPEVIMKQQERAWTSPIWYTP